MSQYSTLLNDLTLFYPFMSNIETDPFSLLINLLEKKVLIDKKELLEEIKRVRKEKLK